MTYIPEYITDKRTDQLWHMRESMAMVMARYLPAIWFDNEAYIRAAHAKGVIAQIDEVMHVRTLKCKKELRAARNPRYLASRK